MRLSHPLRVYAYAAVIALFLPIHFSCLSALAQDVYSNGLGGDLRRERSSSLAGVPSFQDTIGGLTEKAVEDQRERATREDRFRTPKYGSRQLEGYFRERELSPSLKYRQFRE